MKTEHFHTFEFFHLTDAVAFIVTVATCTIFLTAGCMFAKTTETIDKSAPMLSLPQPPAPLELAMIELTPLELAPLEPIPEPEFAMPEMGEGLIHTKTIAVISSTADRILLDESIPFHGIIVQAAGRYEVDPHLIRAIIFAESGYNPNAKSEKGAGGLMQLMPSTAESLGVSDIFDPEENIDGGVRYFRSLLDRFDGDVELALAAYNAGSRHVRNYEGIPPFKATQHYVKKVLKFLQKFKAENTDSYRRLA